MDNLSLALELWKKTQTLGGSHQSVELLKELDSLGDDRNAILIRVVQLIGSDDSSKAHCIAAESYCGLGAKYRKDAIYHIEKWLANPEYMWLNNERYKTQFYCMFLGRLGELYEREYSFDKAIECFAKNRKIRPQYPSSYVNIARCLVKQGKLDEAITFLVETKATDYYKIPYFGSCFNTVIDTCLADIQSKKA